MRQKCIALQNFVNTIFGGANMGNFFKRAAQIVSEDRGFYGVLSICIVAIAVSGYILFFTPAEQESVLDTAVYQSDISLQDFTPVLGDENDSPVIETVQTQEPQETMEQSEQTQEVISQTTEQATDTVSMPYSPAIIRPVAGELYQRFTGNELVYDQTFGDWRTRNGADYIADVGARVYVITDGVVDSIFTDVMLGTCVTVSHENDLQTTYKGLNSNISVEIGDSVKAGDMIGSLNDTNMVDSQDKGTLQIQVMQSGVYIDPETLFVSS